MIRIRSPRLLLRLAAAIVAAGFVPPASSPIAAQQPSEHETFRFRTGVELINVAVTVTDRSGRFVEDLQQSDFRVYDDDQPVDVSYFSAERVPVSLGLVLDTSRSMVGQKIAAARSAIGRFLNDLLAPDDEVFFFTFDTDVRLIHDWTTDKGALSLDLQRLRPDGGTAMYDGVAEAVPMANEGRNRKKAIVLISDGNDTDSRYNAQQVRQRVRQTEVLVYAIGLDAEEDTSFDRPPIFQPRTPGTFPGRPRGPGGMGWPGGVGPGGRQYPPPTGRGRGTVVRGGERVNADALREITDDSGGRTEIVREPGDLAPATTAIANELNKQYYLGYDSPAHRDGRWHTIRVELRNPAYRVRARRGYTATP